MTTDWNSLFDYRDGVLFWKIKPNRNIARGKAAGSLNRVTGYMYVGARGKKYFVHRVIYEMHHGSIEGRLFVDHIDGNRTNNKIENLRLADFSQNRQNSKRPSTNKTGFKGVSFVTKSGKWAANIRLDGRQTYLGAFCSPQEAYATYVDAATRHYGDFARMD